MDSILSLETKIRPPQGAFLPFHRLYLFAHETLLRNDCGYKGYQP
jgi:tyrosinase